jgi:two-component system response regulator FixJ
MAAEGYVIHIIDDHAAVRRSLAMLVRAEGFAAETYSSALKYLAREPNDRDGCVLLDIRLPGMDGLKLLEHVAQDRAALPVIMMTGQRDVETAVRAMKLGAIEFLEKPFAEAALFAAIAAARKSAVTLPVNDGIADASARLASLSRRESEVLAALAAGRQQKLIAHDLGISVRTVEVHRARMMRRLETRSLAEAVRLHVLASFDPAGQRGAARVRAGAPDVRPDAPKGGRRVA